MGVLCAQLTAIEMIIATLMGLAHVKLGTMIMDLTKCASLVTILVANVLILVELIIVLFVQTQLHHIGRQ